MSGLLYSAPAKSCINNVVNIIPGLKEQIKTSSSRKISACTNETASLQLSPRKKHRIFQNDMTMCFQ